MSEVSTDVLEAEELGDEMQYGLSGTEIRRSLYRIWWL